MSWDILLQSLPVGIRSLDEIPADYVPPPLGPRADLIRRIVARLPAVDFSDPAWGRLDGETFSIELNLGTEAEAKALMLHIRGSAEVLGAVREISEALGCRAIDCSEGNIIDFESPHASEVWSRWRAYRDRVLLGGGSD
jgi:hypothetical protein